MDLREIVFRNDSLPKEQSEALFVIKEYIKHRKGVEIQPYLETRLGQMYLGMELRKMTDLMTYAVCWFRENL